MTDLDDLAALTKLDPDDFVSNLETFPEQLAIGAKLGKDLRTVPAGRDVQSIAVFGMGGSGISGDVLRAILEPQSAVFVGSVKGYDVPGWVGPHTLAFAVSYSGTTEEALHALPQVMGRGAEVIVVASGGPLAEAASSSATLVSVPSGLPPRAALGYLAMPILVICERLHLCDIEEAISETIELLERRRKDYKRETPTIRNPAKQLAQDLMGTLPIVYGSEGIGATAAYRWKCQFNECSKVLSFSNTFPELDHNELEGWQPRVSDGPSPATVVALRHAGDLGVKGTRIDVTLSMIERQGHVVRQVIGEGNSSLARLFDLIYLGDFTAAYMGLARGEDPGCIKAIPELKARLAEKAAPAPGSPGGG